MLEQHRHLVVLENTPDVHNLIGCTLCSCTAYTIVCAARDWYKDLEYRARVVRESRTALKEMGLDQPATIERDCRKFWGVSVRGLFPRLFFDREWTRVLGFEVGENRR